MHMQTDTQTHQYLDSAWPWGTFLPLCWQVYSKLLNALSSFFFAMFAETTFGGEWKLIVKSHMSQVSSVKCDESGEQVPLQTTVIFINMTSLFLEYLFVRGPYFYCHLYISQLLTAKLGK